MNLLNFLSSLRLYFQGKGGSLATAPQFSGSSIIMQENIADVMTIVAVDPDGDATITYSIGGGDDAALFEIDEFSGDLSFLSAPDYESPSDADSDNVYHIDIHATDGAETSVLNLTVMVTNVNDEDPVFTSSQNVSVAENTLVGYQPTVDHFTSVTYSISGEDADKFNWQSRDNAFNFNTQPDYESPHDFDGDNVYSFDITATDGTYSSTMSVTITVTNANDNAPVFTSSQNVSVVEGVTGVIYTAVATDVDGETPTYSLLGTDASVFTINSATGELEFVSSPDYESPSDADTNNVYNIVIVADDGVNQQNHTVTVTVTNDVADDGDGGGGESVNPPALPDISQTVADIEAVGFAKIFEPDSENMLVDPMDPDSHPLVGDTVWRWIPSYGVSGAMTKKPSSDFVTWNGEAVLTPGNADCSYSHYNFAHQDTETVIVLARLNEPSSGVYYYLVKSDNNQGIVFVDDSSFNAQFYPSGSNQETVIDGERFVPNGSMNSLDLWNLMPWNQWVVLEFTNLQNSVSSNLNFFGEGSTFANSEFAAVAYLKSESESQRKEIRDYFLALKRQYSSIDANADLESITSTQSHIRVNTAAIWKTDDPSKFTNTSDISPVSSADLIKSWVHTDGDAAGSLVMSDNDPATAPQWLSQDGGIVRFDGVDDTFWGDNYWTANEHSQTGITSVLALIRIPDMGGIFELGGRRNYGYFARSNEFSTNKFFLQLREDIGEPFIVINGGGETVEIGDSETAIKLYDEFFPYENQWFVLGVRNLGLSAGLSFPSGNNALSFDLKALAILHNESRTTRENTIQYMKNMVGLS